MSKLAQIGAAIMGALLVALLVVTIHYHHLAITNGLRADSTAAAADTTRKLVDGVWQRRVIQDQLTQDSLEQQLKLKPKVITQVVVRVDTVHAQGTAIVVADSADSARSAHFDTYQAPVRTLADVMLPRRGVGRIQVTTVLDSIDIQPRLECGEAVGGIRPALLTVSTPTPGVQLGLPHLEAAAEVCNPTASIILPGFHLPWWSVPGAAGLGFLAALLIHH